MSLSFLAFWKMFLMFPYLSGYLLIKLAIKVNKVSSYPEKSATDSVYKTTVTRKEFQLVKHLFS